MKTIILVLIGIILCFLFIKIAYLIDDKYYNRGMSYLVAFFILTGLIFMSSVILIQINHDLNEKVKNKCPEYELIQEPIYKLKK